MEGYCSLETYPSSCERPGCDRHTCTCTPTLIPNVLTLTLIAFDPSREDDVAKEDDSSLMSLYQTDRAAILTNFTFFKDSSASMPPVYTKKDQ